MAYAETIINKARSYIGLKESPANSDNVIFNTDYYGHPVYSTATTKYYWCCTFVWDIFRMCNASKLFYDGGKTASCTALMRWGQNNGLEVAKNKGQQGDIIFFDWDGSGDADHVGLIVKQNNDGSYQTIEGNTSISNNSNGGEVMLRTRNACIRSIIRPKYEVDSLRYRAYCQSYKWLDWQIDGGTAGTTGEAKRLEALQFDIKSEITATCHCQSYGDMKPVYAGNICGTVEEAKRMESIKLEAPYKIEYRVHQQGTGWTKWVTNGTWCGVKGKAKRIEAIEVRRV